MADTFDARLVNDPFDDPVLYVAFRYERRAFLFDLGSIENLSTREVLKVSHLFVSHTHVDHFYGFDYWLRCSLNKEEAVELYGPRGIIANVQGKLAGYTWNLIEDYPLELTVHEVDETAVTSARFRAANRFAAESAGAREFYGVLLDRPSFSVRAAILDHRVPCLAFSLEEKNRLNIRRDALHALGLKAGPWLDDLKRKLREPAAGGERLRAPRADGATVDLSLKEWKEALVAETKGQKIAYVVDNRYCERNIERVVGLAADADLFYCEAAFSRAEQARAWERYHLTAEQAGRLARRAGARRFVPFHFSARYESEPNRLLEEALEAFASANGET
ncbi:MAG TPA: MBL fold metallo-hydrolase [Candidatus Acidoferrales bacterium]|nr:MBL fold metallo-hydrolase [Candidatus Acidoferrales bacterium]